MANQLNDRASVLLANIKKVPIYSDEIKVASPVGINGGTGFSSDGGDLPSAGGQMYSNFVLGAKTYTYLLSSLTRYLKLQEIAQVHSLMLRKRNSKALKLPASSISGGLFMAMVPVILLQSPLLQTQEILLQ